VGAFEESLALLQEHRFAEVKSLLEDLVEREPSNSGALHILSVALLGLGDAARAEEFCRRAAKLAPRRAEVQASLGAILGERGLHDEAIAACERAVKLLPKNADLRGQLGAALARAGKLDGARRAYKRATELAPKAPAFHVALGNVMRRQGALAEAMGEYTIALALDEHASGALTGLGQILLKKNEHEAAAETLQKALALNPHDIDALANLSQAMLRMGHAEAAEAHARTAVELQPNHAAPRAALGSVLLARGRTREAASELERAATLAPDNRQLAALAAMLFAFSGNGEEGCAILERLVERFPDDASIADSLAQTYLIECRIERAVATAKRALELDPSRASTRSFLLGLAHTDPLATDDDLFATAAEWGRVVSEKSARLAPAKPDRDPDRVLRIGYVSADFRIHHVGFVMEAVLPFHDRKQVEVFCYQSNAFEDEQTAAIKKSHAAWRQVSAATDDRVARAIRDDKIDILVDLSGHTSGTRLEAFARKPAPIQATWLGYWATTGLSAIDWILCDDVTLPPSDEKNFIERPWRLPGCYVCIPKPRIPITVSSLPATRRSFVTFACFNNLAILGDEVIATWSAILRGVPQSQLMLRASLLGEDPQATIEKFLAHGVEAAKLTVVHTPRRFDILRAYHDVDIALDPFPYSCGATSAEAIFMSVPVIAKRGTRYVARITESMMKTIDLPYVAAGADEYAKMAIALASDLETLSSVRVTLREKLLESPLGNGKLFTKRLESAYRAMWQQYLRETS